jgi:hypothetical protein
MTGRGSGAVEVTTMRAAATVTTEVMISNPLFPLAMVRDDEREGRFRRGNISLPVVHIPGYIF